ncbi:large exoprotein [Microbacterium sp. NPDC076911]|uniref:large exoprotein n=1 Tax=Microbacterium sp. NPDC076911 TaxID=3154958 RepID=UPI003442C41D
MGGQVLGGGVIVLVAVLLWLVYLVPSWYGRRQYDAAERNAVRLNQALRILAETSETPEEVRLELNARTAAAQQRLAKRASAQREQSALEQARIELEEARLQRIAASQTPRARQARARRRFRLALTSISLVAVGVAAWGAVQVVMTGSQLLLWAGLSLAGTAALLLQRMSRVGAREVTRTMDAAARPAVSLQDVALETAPQRQWAPRTMPRPLTASAGSQAASMLDAEAARTALKQAALEEDLRQRAEAQRPPSIAVARTAHAAHAPSEYSRMGYVDDAEIEAHVRDLLSKRAAGQ